jgi:FLVCR family feline leukemia virus subgroup C receptor-related protein
MGFFFLSIVIVVYDSLPPILLAILNFFIGAGTGGLYSLFLESLMEKHYPIQELTIGTVLFIVASVIKLTSIG